MLKKCYADALSYINEKSIDTPVMFYSELILNEALSIIQDSLGDKITIYYALKSCYHPHILKSLSRKTGVEVMSEFEYDLARKYGFTSILLNGMGRNIGLFRKAVDDSSIILLDSVNDIDNIETIADSCDKDILVGFRLRIHIPELANTNSYVSTDHPLGNNLDTEFSARFFKLIAEHTNVKWSMIHAHMTINEMSSEIYKKTIEKIASTLRLSESAYKKSPAIINIGGGFEVYDPGCRNSFKLMFDSISRTFNGYFGDKYSFAIEPGRFLTGHAGFSIGRVLDIKEVGKKYWVITDIGTNTLIPIPNARYQLALPEPAANGKFTVGVTDGITSPSNNIVHATRLSTLPAIGSFICIENTGSYTDVYSTFWAYSPNKVYWIDDAGTISPYRTTQDIKEMYDLFFKNINE